jgi:hypothetical protein
VVRSRESRGAELSCAPAVARLLASSVSPSSSSGMAAVVVVVWAWRAASEKYAEPSAACDITAARRTACSCRDNALLSLKSLSSAPYIPTA